MSADWMLRVMQSLPIDWGAGRRWLRKRLMARCGNAVRSNVFGRATVFHLDNNSEYKFMMSHLVYNRREIDFIMGGLSEVGSVFLDIGANGGIYSFAVACRTKVPLRLFAIEPNPDMCERIATNLVELNDFSASGVEVKIENTALGVESGTVWLDTSTGLGTAHVSEKETRTGYRVKLEPLLDLCARNEIDRIGALKIDVEGYESVILSAFFRDAPVALRPQRIVIEHLYDTNADFLERLIALGYERVGRTRNNLLLRYVAPQS